ncbi:MAG: patatin-like phospholipase family protein [Hydrogenophaga sp.]|nr:patatin-like phospholipase family protein [Hydrogenophaga sp.]
MTDTSPTPRRRARRSTAVPTAQPAPLAAGDKRQLDLALQGGGSHGAFTWGVLDRLLDEEWLEVAAISGTSAGAMNAVVLASGLMDGGRTGAQRALHRFWQRVAQLSPFQGLPGASPDHPLTRWAAPWLEPMQQAATLWSGQFSPYQFNPLNLNPLRDVLNDTVDFERVRSCHKTMLFISATQVRTGALRVFDQRVLSADVVMASACLPQLFQAVDIDGEAYWDGGYAGNPSLLPLITESPADDLLLVQINPIERASVPTSVGDILDRVSEITFNASLIKELRSLALLQELLIDEVEPGHCFRHPLLRRVQALRTHLLDGGEALVSLGAKTKTQTHWPFLQRLHRLGRAAADRWLAEHGGAIGQRSTYHLHQVLAP